MKWCGLWQVEEAAGGKEETELEHFLCGTQKKKKDKIISVSKGKQV